MPRVELTSHMRRHVDLAPGEVDGSTLREVLDAYLARDPRARRYVFDEQGALRHHVSIFVDGVVVDRHTLDVAIAKHASVYVMQSLSGG